MFISKVLESGEVEQWRWPIDGAPPVMIAAARHFANNNVRVHPDGRHVVFPAAVQKRRDEVWVLENFLPSMTAGK